MPGEPPSTTRIVDVAAAAGVSRATAARALGGYGSVSPAVRERVMASSAELAYRANGVARSMITGRTMTLAAVVADIGNDFFARVVRGFTDHARDEGFDTIVANTDEDVASERAALGVLLEQRVDGVMLAPASMRQRSHLADVRRSRVPVVLVDRRVERMAFDVVAIDGVAAAHQATSRLVAAGHHRIGLITGGSVVSRSEPSTTTDRMDGYLRALDAASLTPDPALVSAGDFHVASARERTCALLQQPHPPTALLATDGALALGALLGIRDAGLSCPTDISLVGFDDPAWASLVDPALTVIAQPSYDLGQVAAQRLVARVRGLSSRARTQFLPTTWHERASIGPPAQWGQS